MRKELRSRGVWARMSLLDAGAVSVPAIGAHGIYERPIVLDVSRYLPAQGGYPASVPLAPFDKMSVKAIADVIQSDDARRLREWGEGEETTT